MNANYLAVLEDVLEVGQYPFTAISMRKCVLTDKEIGIIAPMLDSNTRIKRVSRSRSSINGLHTLMATLYFMAGGLVLQSHHRSRGQ